MRDAIQIRTRDLFIYALLTLFTFGSLWLGSLPVVSNSTTISTVQHILVGLLGFMNSLVFFFQRIRSQETGRMAAEFLDSIADDHKERDSIQRMLFAEAHKHTLTSGVRCRLSKSYIYFVWIYIDYPVIMFLRDDIYVNIYIKLIICSK